MGLTLKVAPGEEPVTLAEAKLHCKGVDGTTDDTLITGLIMTARRAAEHRTGRALVTQQWEYTHDDFDSRIDLPKPALISVQSVKYLDSDGVLQTLASSEYQVVTSELIGYIVPAYGKSWPSCRVQPDSVVVAYTAGFGNAAAVPDDIKTWMKMAISTMYNQREGIITGISVAEVPRDFFAGLLDPHVVPTV